MFTIALGIVLVIGLCFGLVVFFGAPYLPTLSKQVDTALELADLQPGQTLLELGCGDGRILLAAAERGWQVIGYELNPLLVLLCKIRTWRYRRQVTVHWSNFMSAKLPHAQAIFIFGIAKLMPKLDKKIMQSPHKPVKLISFAFELPQKQPSAKRNGLFLYKYN